jgi:hypothetical protein
MCSFENPLPIQVDTIPELKIPTLWTFKNLLFIALFDFKKMLFTGFSLDEPQCGLNVCFHIMNSVLELLT